MDAAQLPAPQLGRILIAARLLTEEQLAQALEEQEQTGRRLGEIIVQRGFISGPALANALAEQHGGVLKTEYGFASGLGGDAARRAASEAYGGAPVPQLRLPDSAQIPQLRTAEPEPIAPAAEPEPIAPAPEPEPIAPAPEPIAQAEGAEPPAPPEPEPVTPPAPEPIQEQPEPPSIAEIPQLRTAEPDPEPATPDVEPEPQPMVHPAGEEPPTEQPSIAPPAPEEHARPTPPTPLLRSAEVPEPEPEPEPAPEPVPEPEPEAPPVPVPPAAVQPPVHPPTPVDPAPQVVPQPAQEQATPSASPAPEPVQQAAELEPVAAVTEDHDALIESLHARLEAQEQELVQLRELLAQERARAEVQVHVWPEEQATAAPASAAEKEHFLLCVPTSAGYVLLDRVGVLPTVGQAVEVPEEEGRFLVTKIVRLPRNGRPCAYLQRA